MAWLRDQRLTAFAISLKNPDSTREDPPDGTKEEYVNHQADRFELPWEADSRALTRDLAATGNQGPISSFAVTELQRRAIPIRGGARHPMGVESTDFETAHRIIAVSRREHEPMLRENFPEVLERIRYFEIGDLDVETPATAIARLTQAIDLEIAALWTRHDA
jgi:protein-tyrosine phosphatase